MEQSRVRWVGVARCSSVQQGVWPSRYLALLLAGQLARLELLLRREEGRPRTWVRTHAVAPNAFALRNMVGALAQGEVALRTCSL